MISNIYSYLFVSAVSLSMGTAVLIRILLQDKRKQKLEVLSPPILISFIISVITLIIGSLLSEIEIIKWQSYLFFSVIVYLPLSAVSVFIRKLIIPILVLILVTGHFYMMNALRDFTPFGKEEMVHIRLLKIDENQTNVEVQYAKEISVFLATDSESLKPEFTLLQFPDFFFIIPNSHYYLFNGFSNSPDLKIAIPALPSFLFDISKTELPSLELAVLSQLSISFETSGNVTVK